MKKTIAGVCLIMSAFTVRAQGDGSQLLTTLVTELEKTASVRDHRVAIKDYQDLTEGFLRIADAHKTQWLPYYYAAYCNAKIGWLYQDDGEQVEPYANKGDEEIKKALSLLDTTRDKKGLSEVYCVMSMVNQAKVFINPMTYGRQYGPSAARYVQLAKAANPDNPRALYLEGWEKYTTPKMWGGDKKKAKEILLAAKQKFDGQADGEPSRPHWGRQDVDELLAKE